MAAVNGTKETFGLLPSTEVQVEQNVAAPEQAVIQSPAAKVNGIHDTSLDSTAAEEKPATNPEDTTQVYTAGSEKFQKYYAAVHENPSDFPSWTCLLQTAEQEELPEARKAFDEFLRMYPYCYGYWKKYADLEKKNGNVELAQAVFQRGIAAIPLSIDLWVHFLNFTSQVTKTQADSHVIMRSLFEAAINAAGLEFNSDKLWDAYIEWEKSLSNWKFVLSLYDRLFRVPTHQYKKHFEKFKTFVEMRQPSEILPTEEYLKLRSEVAAIPIGSFDDGDTLIPTGAPGVDPYEDNDIAPPGETSTEQYIVGDQSSQSTREIGIMRDKIISLREEVHLLNEEEVVRRTPYEELIKRPYFHVKPLEKTQRKNWEDYLGFEIACGNDERIEILFERCLIACASYEEMWQKYATYMESKDVEKARNVYTRACTIHLYRKVNINMNWAAFEEAQGNIQGAATILDNMYAVFPGLLMVLIRRIGMSVRCGHIEQAYNMYESVISESASAEEKVFLSLKYARLVSKAGKNKAKAREILDALLEQNQDNQRIYLQLLDLEINVDDLEVDKLEILYNKVLASETLPLSFKQSFGQRYLSILEDTGQEVMAISRVYNAINGAVAADPNATQLKRPNEDLAGASTEAKVPKVEDTVQDPNALIIQQQQQQQQYAVAGTVQDATATANTMAYAGYTDPWAAYAQTAAGYYSWYPQYSTATGYTTQTQ